MSFDAVHVSETLVRVALEIARFVGCEGGVVSPVGGGGGGGEQADVETVSWACCEELPAASRATTAKVYAVPHESPVWLEVVALDEATFEPLR